jgi:hypothetical protein
MDQAQTGIAGALAGTRAWVRLLSILGFIGAGFMVLAGIGMAVFGAAVPGTGGWMAGGAMAAVGLLYICMALLYLMPSMYLWQYGNGINAYLADPQEAQLERALDAQRKFWKFAGVLTLIGILFFFGSIVLGVLGSLMMRGGMSG